MEYKEDPNNLPLDVFKHAYGDDTPAMHAIPGLIDSDFVRKNAKELSPGGSSSSKGLAPGASCHVAPPQGMDMQGLVNLFGPAMMCMMQRLIDGQSPPNSQSTRGQDLQLQFNQGMGQLGAPRRPSLLAIGDRTAPGAAGPTAEPGVVPPGKPDVVPPGVAPALGRPASQPCLADLQSEPDLTDEEATLREAMHQKRDKTGAAAKAAAMKRPAEAGTDEPAAKKRTTAARAPA